MSTVTLEAFRADLTAVLNRVAAGEPILIERGDGRAFAEVRPVVAARTMARPFGLAAGEFVVPDDFDAPLPDDVLRDFEGR